MALESATYISDLVTTNPVDTDPEGYGADHIRLLKVSLKGTLPNITGAITATQASLNAAGALFPSGVGALQVPYLTTYGSNVLLKGTTGQGDANIQYLSQSFSVTINDSANANPLQVLYFDRSGQMFLKGPSAALFLNTTLVSWVGEVRMHAGSIASIPTGWHLCDGTAGTPDLRDRFIVGAGNVAPGTVGGVNSITLTYDNLPSHSHFVIDPGHTHGVTDPQHVHPLYDPGHSHPNSQTFLDYVGSGGNSNIVGGSQVVGQSVTVGVSNTGITMGSALTGVTVNSGTTSISIGASGNGNPFDNRPAFYALCFVMRIA